MYNTERYVMESRFCTYCIFRTMLFEPVFTHVVKRHETGKIVVCLHTDTINSTDALNITRLMTTPPNVTANDKYYIEQVTCVMKEHTN